MSRRGVVIRNVAEMERTSTSVGSSKDAASVKKDIEDKVEFVVGGSRTDISPKDAYRGAAWSLRERLIEAFNHTHAHWEAEDPKFVYYLSAEFLMGRSLLNTVYNLELGEEYSAALRNLGYSLEEVQQQERDAALGNGGLGRLAACFLDSIATLDLPGWGYGIRYRYGMFKQALKDGYQIELPDIWLTEGNPWEIPRPSLRYPVNFYGKLDERTGVWIPGETVMAVAFDNPIPGYDTPTCSNLRLWDAQPVTELDLAAFNEGEYYDAVEEKRRADAIASVLYPNDATEEGKLLRLKQQFFFVTASLQDTIARYKAKHGDSIKGLEEKAFFQLNDTHPTIAVSELMRLLMDQEGLGWNEAWAITTKSLAYTNHTVMPEALEKWPVAVIEKLLPRNMFIINQIQRKWEAFLNNHYSSLDKAGREEKIQKMSIIQENPWEPGVKLVNMAYLAVVGSSTVNGVAAIHSEIIKDTIFNDFYQVWPEKFQNKTNGVTPRRWLKFCNPELSALISEALGTEDWVNNMKLLEGLKPFAEDAEFRAKWRAVKQERKAKLAAYLENMTGDTVPTTSMFDIQIKRIHEYKRQLLNVLSIIWRYKQLKKMSPEERAKVVPRVCVVGGKAASAYDMAKRIVHLVNAVGNVINKDPETKDLLRLYFIPDYNVSLAEMIIPATELSQHISTGGTEASGTSNMKFAMNGAFIIGTMDGANIEIGENTGMENLFIFGVLADEVDQLRKDRVDFETDPRWDQIMDWIEDGEFGDMLYFKPLVDSVNNMKVGNDWFLVANDFASYLDAQEKVDELYKDQEEWTRRSILYTANSGFFSSDRTIADYAENIWGVQGCRPN